MKTVLNLICGGRMVKWKGRVASLAPALASVSVAALMATGAVGEVVINNNNDDRYITVDEDITVAGDVVIVDSDNMDVDLVAVDTGDDYAGTITVDGSIQGLIGTDGVSNTSNGYFVALTVYNGLSGSIVNNGEISMELVVADNTNVTAMGVWIDGDLSGSIVNNGTVSALNNNTNSTANAYGIYIEGDVTETGSVTNSGLIEATAIANDSYAYAYGIYIDGGEAGEVSGAITNTADGVISVLAESGSYTASAWGIYLSTDLSETGSITNAGSISVTAEAKDEYYAYAYGIEAGNIAGTISNSGTITVLAQGGSSTATAYGISVGDVSGTITNSGTLSVEANTGSSSDALAYGIDAGDLSGAILNTGTIEVVADAHSSTASAYGIYVNSVTETGSITNQGLISASAHQLSSYAYAYGIYVDNDMDGSISNTGDIIVDATMSDAYYGSAYGIYISGTANGSITNAGLVDVTLKASDGTTDSTVYGIYIGGDLNGSLTNTATGVINILAEPGFSSATSYGLYIGGDVAEAASVLNAGSITLTNTGFGSVTAYGIYVSNDVVGTLTNTGTITLTSTSVESQAYAYGIEVASDVFGTVENTGSITVSATANDYSYASVDGIYISGTVEEGGSVSNSGTITATANAGTEAYAWGIETGNVDGTLTNTASGVITVAATGGDSYSAYAYGIEIDNLNGTLTNAGLIDVTADDLGDESTTDVVAYGIYADGIYLGGNLTNSGNIEVLGSAEGPGVFFESTGTVSYTAVGIWIDSAIQDGTVTNSGTIDVSFDATGSANDDDYTAEAYGVYAGRVDTSGTIDNQGMITVSSAAVDNSAYAYGVYVDNSTINGMDGTLLNSGTINVSATTTDGEADENGSASAYGIYVDGISTGTITNTGLIEVSASSTIDTADAYGVIVTDLASGTFENSGVINVTASSTSDEAVVYGVQMYNVGLNASVINSGEIIVGTTDSTSAYEDGVYLSNFEGYFENTGKIVSGESAIDINGGEAGGSVMLSTAGFISGTVSFNRSDVEVQGDAGMSVLWTLDDEDTIAGANTVGEDGAVPVFTSGLDTDAPQYATFDASSIVANRQQGANSAMAGLGDLVAKTAASTGVSAQVTSGPADAGGFKPFINASSSRLTYAGGDAAMDQSVNTTALTVGGTNQTDGGMTFGLAAGTAMGATSVAGQWETASESKSNSAFAGVSLASTMGNMTLSGGITAGSVNFDNTRFVNDNLAEGGIAEMASTNSDKYMALQLGLTGRFAVGADMALLPSASVSYANHSTTGFSEAGDAGATVDASAFGVAQGEFGLTVEKTLPQGVLSLGISQISRRINGSTSVDVSMLDDTNAIDTSISSASATKISIGYTAGTVGSAQFNFGAETLLGSGGVSGSKIGGTISFRF